MKMWMCITVAGACSLLAGCESPSSNQPLDQSRIISVRPAVPEGARAFVAQQQKLQEQQQKRARSIWLARKPAQPAQTGHMQPVVQAPAKPASDGKWMDIFNPGKWGKARQEAPKPQVADAAVPPSGNVPPAAGGQPAGQLP